MGSDWQAGTVRVGGIALRFHRTGGDLPTIVLAHGITDSGLCWARLSRALEDDYDMVMYDARGHGQSDHPGSYTFAEHVADLVGVIEGLALSRPILVGHSMGGAHVAAVAATRPDLVDRLVLEDPHWPSQPEDPAGYRIEQWRSDLATDKVKPLDELLEVGRRDNPGWVAEDLEPWARAKQAVDPAVPNWLYSSYDIDRWRDTVAKVSCSTLLVTGDPGVDPNVTVRAKEAQQARELCPQLSIVHIPDAGHSIHRDQFQAYLTAVKDFLG
jgi:N-formylmaleamate deformylase